MTEFSQNVAAGVSKPAVPGGGRRLHGKAVDEEEVEDGAAEEGSQRV